MDAAPAAQGSGSRGLLIWAALSAGFWIGLAAAATQSPDASAAAVLYQGVLFAACSFPALVLAREPRYRLLAFFMLVYYAMFGLRDLVLMFTRSQYQIYTGIEIERTTLADWLIIGGALLATAGYTAVVALWPSPGRAARRSWTYRASLAVGFVLWTIGICANFVVQFVYAYQERQQHVGVGSVIISNLYYLAFLGDAILLVTAFRHPGRRASWLLVGLMMIVEYGFGFVGNIKEVSYRIPVLILICSFFCRGRINLKWALLLVLSFIPYQALFNVYREQVLQVYHRSALDAVTSARKSVDAVLSRYQHEREPMAKSAFTMLDRVDGRKYVEIITQRTGVSVPYQDGETFKFLAYSFVPVFWWPDKPQLSTGQLMNRTFHLSLSRETFVPSTILGEFYWNFGVTGVIWGMLLVGVIFALVNCSFLRDDRYSTAGMLAVLLVAYFLAARFEASVASQYGQCIRVLLILAAIDGCFAVMGWKSAIDSSTPRGRQPVRAEARRLTYLTPEGASP